MLLLALTLACAPPPYDPPQDSVDTAPGIEITWPLPETRGTGCVVVTMYLRNFSLVDFHDGRENAEGEGHIHLLHPAGPNAYDVCLQPFCIAHFEKIPSVTEDYLTAQLENNDHSPVLGADGEPVEMRIPFGYEPGACTSYLDAQPEDTGDTGAGDTGANGG